MSAPGPGSLLLFVAGDPSLANELVRFPKGLPLLAAFLLPASILLGPAPPQQLAAGEEVWLIPADQVMCLERVGAALQGRHRTVKVVDVNHPSDDDRRLVVQYVGAEDILPILVRPDGARLEGVEAFAPSALRRFVGSGEARGRGPGARGPRSRVESL